VNAAGHSESDLTPIPESFSYEQSFLNFHLTAADRLPFPKNPLNLFSNMTMHFRCSAAGFRGMLVVRTSDSEKLLQFLRFKGLLAEVPDLSSLIHNEGPLQMVARLGLLSERAALEFLSKEFRIPCADLDHLPFNLSKSVPPFQKMVDPHLCWDHRIVPLVQKPEYIGVACANPFSREALRTIEFALCTPIREVLAEERQILRVLGEYLPL